MTAETVWTDRSDATDAEFAEVLAKFEAAPAAAESLRERVARACWKAAHRGNDADWPLLNDWARGMYLDVADAALAVMRGEQP